MEQIEQLKIMRDAAQERLRASPDFKLKNSLDALIDDLEAFISGDESGVIVEAANSDPQEELVATDDEEEQQDEESHIEPVTDEYNFGTRSYDDDEQVETVVQAAAEESDENSNQNIEDNEFEDSDIAEALAQNISAEDIHNEQDANGSDFVNSSQLDMEAEAAIEALEAELAQSDADVSRP